MTKTEFAKRATSLVVGIGTAKVVKEIIRNNVKNSEHVTDQAAMIIATYVLGMMAADATKDWTDAKIDKVIDWWMKNVTAQI